MGTSKYLSVFAYSLSLWLVCLSHYKGICLTCVPYCHAPHPASCMESKCLVNIHDRIDGGLINRAVSWTCKKTYTLVCETTNYWHLFLTPQILAYLVWDADFYKCPKLILICKQFKNHCWWWGYDDTNNNIATLYRLPAICLKRFQVLFNVNLFHLYKHPMK